MTRGAGRKDRATGTFGSVDKLATGYRARYCGPDGRRYTAPTLFLTKTRRPRLAVAASGRDHPQGVGAARDANRTRRAQADLRRLRRALDDRARPEGPHPRALPASCSTTTCSTVRVAADGVDHRRRCAGLARQVRHHDTDAARALLRPTAHDHGHRASDGKITVNPCVIRGAGTAKRVHQIRPATLDELEIITDEMPDQYRAMVLLASWCALRFGELTELRRMDIDTAPTKSFAFAAPWYGSRRGVPSHHTKVRRRHPRRRDTAAPAPGDRDHLAKHVGERRDSLLFPAQHGGHLAPATLYRRFYTARDAANRPDLRLHDLRHSGAVLAAATGATLAELMARLGHSTPAAAMRYQHAAKGRDREIAALLGKLADNRGV